MIIADTHRAWGITFVIQTQWYWWVARLSVVNTTKDPRYNDSFCYQKFCCKIEFAVINKLDMNPSKARMTDIFEQLFFSHTFCAFVRIAMYVFPKKNMRLSMKKYTIRWFVFPKKNMGLSMKKYTIRWFLCRSDWRYNEFCCYNECRFKEGHRISMMYG